MIYIENIASLYNTNLLKFFFYPWPIHFRLLTPAFSPRHKIEILTFSCAQLQG